MESNTETKTEKKISPMKKILGYVLYIWMLAMLFTFTAIILFIDFVSWSVVEELKKVNGILNPPTELILNVDSTGFIDYFLRYQLITVIIGIVVFIIAFKFLSYFINIAIVPMFNDLREDRRKAWRTYLNSGFTYKDLSEEQINGLNLRKKAIDLDLFVIASLATGILTVMFFLMMFFELDRINEPNNNLASIVILGIVILALLIFVEWGKNHKKPMLSIEKLIKNDESWSEFLAKKDKEKEQDQKV